VTAEFKPHPSVVDDVLAATHPRRPRDDDHGLDIRGAAAARQWDTLPVGTFVSFLLYTTMFLAPIDVIGQMARTINRATTSAHRVFEVLDTEPEIRDVAERWARAPVCRRVTLSSVTFATTASGRCCGA